MNRSWISKRRWKYALVLIWLSLLVTLFIVPQSGSAQVLLTNIEDKKGLAYQASSPESSRLAVVPSTDHKVVSLWDLDDRRLRKRRKITTGHEEWIDGLVFSPNGRLLVTAGFDDHSVKLWDSATGTNKGTLRLASGFRKLTFSPDSKLFAVSHWNPYNKQGGVKLYDSTTAQELATLPGLAKTEVRRLAFSPDGKTLATSSEDWFKKFAEIKLWEVGTYRLKATLPSALGYPMNVLFSPDGRLLATWSCGEGPQQRELKLWDAATGRLKFEFKGYKTWVRAVAFSPDSRTLATGGGVQPIELANTERLGLLPTELDLKQVGSELKLWEVASGKVRTDLDGHQDPIWSIAFSPDGRRLASSACDWNCVACERRDVRLWDLTTPERKWVRLPGHINLVTSVAFWPDGRTLVTAGKGEVKLWDVSAWPREKPRQPVQIASAKLNRLWADLANEDVARAYRAIQQFILARKDAGLFLSNCLKPISSPNPKLLSRLIKDLDNDQVSVRERAYKELQQMGELAEAALHQALHSQSPLEVSQRVETLLKELEGPVRSMETLRGLRAVEVLEYLGTREAYQLLERLAEGIPHARLTQAAKDAVGRLSRQKNK